MARHPRHRGTQTYRLIRTMVLLKRASVRPTIAVLAREVGVSERTMKRYIATLNELHIAMPPTVNQVEW